MNHLATRRAGGTDLVRYATGSRAAASIEGVLSITMLVLMFASIMGIVSAFQLQSRVERAAWAIARANALALGPAASADHLTARVRAAVAAEVGVGLDPARLVVTVTAYATPTDLQGGVSTGQPSASLGGDADDMVVVRVQYNPEGLNPMRRPVSGTVIRSVAVVRNEAGADG
jgi:hypothetical protein